MAFAIAGAAVAGDILGRYHSFVQKCIGPGCTQADKDGLANEAVAVDALFVVAGAAGAAAIGVFFFAEGGLSHAPPAKVGLTIGPSGAVISGKF